MEASSRERSTCQGQKSTEEHRRTSRVESGRKLVPTKLGIALVKAYQSLDPELAQPEMRAQVEAKLNKIARGEADYDSVKNEILSLYKQKYSAFTQRFAEVEHLFKDCFPPRQQQQNSDGPPQGYHNGSKKQNAQKRHHPNATKNGSHPGSKRVKH
ncbi:DNA topoisomerase [Aphelenchoides avenae]|nr:DNA topoisomerase [Aphelenchus avenae]